MIEKLSQKIFWLIMIIVGVVVLSIITIFAIFNFRNTIDTVTFMMDRIDGGMRKGIEARPEEPRPNINLEGVYYIRVVNSQVEDSTIDAQMADYAIKLSKKDNSSGIIGNYIYKVRRIRENETMIMLMENAEAIFQVKMIIITSVILAAFSIIVIYIIAKKISKSIVKPVEETFEKQKQFISDASHELKTPLAVIEANADVLEGEVGKNKWVEYIQNEIESMNKLVNELLLLAKLENVESKKDYINISEQTELILSMFNSMAYEKNVKLNSNIEENICINCSKEDIEHILSTLVDNAIKHTDAEKEVMVELAKEKNNIIWKVKNQGEEIPEKEREKIFERFYRIDKSRNRKEKRYGLGLAIAKSVVQKYKGNIEVEYKEGYTIFKVTIPT